MKVRTLCGDVEAASLGQTLIHEHLAVDWGEMLGRPKILDFEYHAMRDKMVNALNAAHALGVPVEFQNRKSLQPSPVVGMRGYGTHHQPPGTWSDDSSLMLCTVASLNECNCLDLDDLAKRFVAWRYENYLTPWGNVFDIGNATASAIGRLQRGVSPTVAGGADEQSNGNGSLMRILPVALYFRHAPLQELIQAAHDVSALTHRHPRSQMACGMYCLLVSELLRNQSPMDAYHSAIELASAHFKKDATFSAELKHYERSLNYRKCELVLNYAAWNFRHRLAQPERKHPMDSALLSSAGVDVPKLWRPCD